VLINLCKAALKPHYLSNLLVRAYLDEKVFGKPGIELSYMN
jgi:hypothetical protein